ncbi:MAG: DUF4416 family protein, partial [Planctomycetes bacterium]|nr:DUF4416 family protein [Planctomycetota bacterium]
MLQPVDEMLRLRLSTSNTNVGLIHGPAKICTPDVTDKSKQMWKLKEPKPVKLIVGILAADRQCLHAAVEIIEDKFDRTDFVSDVWPFDQTDYYKNETGPYILRQFVSVERLTDPGKLAKI